MPPPPLTFCFATIYRNPTTKDRFYPFLPPHGRWIKAGETLFVEGGPWERRSNSARKDAQDRKGIFDALVAGELEILTTPAQIVTNPTMTQTRMVVLTNAGTLGVTDPCWTDWPY